MARVSKVEACILCEEVPCSCNSKSRPRKTAPKKNPVQVEAKKSPEKHTPQSVSEEDLIELACIRVLAPILHPQELTKYGAMLASPPSVRERSVIWKARRSK